MTTVEVTATVSDGVISANIDGKKLTFVGGVASRALADGEHSLQWFVLASPGATYKIEITKPTNVKCMHAATIDGSKKDAGFSWFTVPGLAAGNGGAQ